MASTRSDAVGAPAASDHASRRRDLLAGAEPGLAGRTALAALTDDWLADLFARACADAGYSGGGVALVAVGGYGRRELAPGSDLDLVLLHSGQRDVAPLAEKIWYPVWDSGVRLDHAVRTVDEGRRLAGRDLAVLLGLLDARLVAGDPGLAGRLRSVVLADWRAAARRRLPELRAAWDERAARSGDLRHDLEPDLKEGRGGLRDLVTLRAVVATWVADRPHRDVDPAVRRLADVRDGLHLVTGRPGNRLLQQEQPPVAARLGLADADHLLREVVGCASAVVHAAEVTWRRAEQACRRTPLRSVRGRRPVLRLLGPGLADHDGEAVLTAQADPASDPVLVLRMAARAARAGLPPAPSSLDRLVSDAAALPEPWPEAARSTFVDLLGSGAALVGVWESLDQAGLLSPLLPEWDGVRHLPQRSPVHRFTVDRHLLETAVQAAALVRRVARPDLLLLGALLHDLGKGVVARSHDGDHSEAGVEPARAVATRIGLPPEDVEVVTTLVRHHLLLAESATRRDPEDPATVSTVAAAVGSREVLDLLHALTVADALAAGPGAWSEWKARLVAQLAGRSAAVLTGRPLPPLLPMSPEQRALVEQGRLVVAVEAQDPTTLVVTVAAPDRVGLFAAIAGVLSVHRLSVRSARLRTEGGMALDEWTVEVERDADVRADDLRRDIGRALDGGLDLARRLERRDAAQRPPAVPAPPATVLEVTDASAGATVVEVRAADRPGLLHRLGRALALLRVDVRAAHVSTLGASAVDVFYLVDERGERLDGPSVREVLRVLADAAR